MGTEVEEVEEVVDECGLFGFIIFLFGYITPPVPVHTQEMLSVGIFPVQMWSRTFGLFVIMTSDDGGGSVARRSFICICLLVT